MLTRSRTRSAAARIGVALLVVLTLAGCYWSGPDPTSALLADDVGPLAYAQVTVPANGDFGGGTISYPTDTSHGTYGAVAVMPGFVSGQDTIAWYGPRLASWGFVVFTLDSITLNDFPAARGNQLLAALHYLTAESSVADRVDPNRMAVMGWSMGGGGALEAAAKTPSLKAVVGLAPWESNPNFSSMTVPTMVVACQSDTIAPIDQHAKPIYASLPDSIRKAYLEIAGGSHFCVTKANATIATSVVSFLKRQLDSDTRYTPFLCPPPDTSSAISAYQANCPYN